MSSCFAAIAALFFTTSSVGFLRGSSGCSDFSCVLASATFSAYPTVSSVVSATFSAYPTVSSVVSATISPFILDKEATATATATASYNFMVANNYSPEEICNYNDLAVRHLPCSNTVTVEEENIWIRTEVHSYTELTTYESTVWQWNADDYQQTSLTWIGIPMQVIGGSVRIQVEMHCTSIENYSEPRLPWDVYPAEPFTIEYSDSPAYENVWLKFVHPVRLHANDACRVFYRLIQVSDNVIVHLQMDHLEPSFTFGLVS